MKWNSAHWRRKAAGLQKLVVSDGEVTAPVGGRLYLPEKWALPGHKGPHLGRSLGGSDTGFLTGLEVFDSGQQFAGWAAVQS